jgi:hypothetical protein
LIERRAGIVTSPAAWGFSDLLDGDSHLPAVSIDGDAPQDPSMPLDHIALPGFEDGRGVHFPMMNGNMPVRVFVPRAPLGEGQSMARFNESRDIYDPVARGKYETGKFIATMTIELAEIAQYSSGRQRCSAIRRPGGRFPFEREGGRPRVDFTIK